jgi:Xaa-Pro dipeptidase
MRKLVEYPTPSLNERDRRWAAVRKEMDARELDCLILCGWPAMWDFNIANARYLLPDRRQRRVQRAGVSARG